MSPSVYCASYTLIALATYLVLVSLERRLTGASPSSATAIALSVFWLPVIVFIFGACLYDWAKKKLKKKPALLS